MPVPIGAELFLHLPGVCWTDVYVMPVEARVLCEHGPTVTITFEPG